MKRLYTKAFVNRAEHGIGKSFEASITELNRWARMGLISKPTLEVDELVKIHNHVAILRLLPQPPKLAFKDLHGARLVVGDIDEMVAAAVRLTWYENLVPIYNSFSFHDKMKRDADLTIKRIEGYCLSGRDNRAISNGWMPLIPDPSAVIDLMGVVPKEESSVVFHFLASAMNALERPSGDPEDAKDTQLDSETIKAILMRIDWFGMTITPEFLISIHAELRDAMDFPVHLEKAWVQGAYSFMRDAVDWLYRKTLIDGSGPQLLSDK